MNRTFRITLFTVLGAVMAAATMAGVLWADTLSSHYVPERVSYQGFLTDAAGDPISGTVTLEFSLWDASTGGNQLWGETHSNVSVARGYFSVLLGSQGSPLGVDDFKGTPRYLQVVYGGTTFPRQVFASVPYALVSHYAVDAGRAISSTYAMTATYAMNSGGSGGGGGVDWQYVVVVAKSGGDYTSLNAALAAISPSGNARYLILVMPGVYNEQVTLPEYVHVKGAGIHSTIISYAASTGNFNDAAAATLTMGANTQLSDIAVYNTSNTQNGVGVRVDGGNDATLLENVRIRNTDGGNQRIGLFMRTAGSPKVSHVNVTVSGGTANNWGLYVNATEPVVHDAYFRTTGTGSAAMRTAGGSATIKDSVLDGSNGSNGVGISTSGGGNYTFYIDRSSIIGDVGTGSSISSNDNNTFYVGASRLGGDVDVFAPATITCAQSYNGSYVDVGANCN